MNKKDVPYLEFASNRPRNKNSGEKFKDGLDNTTPKRKEKTTEDIIFDPNRPRTPGIDHIGEHQEQEFDKFVETDDTPATAEQNE